MEKLKNSTDPVETEDLEDQILRLVDQEEDFNTFTNQGIKEVEIQDTKNSMDELDDKEKIRLQRVAQKEAKEAKYRSESKLGSVDEELLRSQLMNEALASNEEFAFQKSRKHFGAKNKSKKRI